jgi:hypothetical protein
MPVSTVLSRTIISTRAISIMITIDGNALTMAMPPEKPGNAADPTIKTPVRKNCFFHSLLSARCGSQHEGPPLYHETLAPCGVPERWNVDATGTGEFCFPENYGI